MYLGTISLGFYLFHLALMTNIQEWLAPDGTSGDFYGSLPTVFLLTFVASIAAASVSYLLIERPFLRLKDRPLSSVFTRQHAGDGVTARAHARHHPRVQRGGVAARGAQGAGRADARARRARGVATAPPTAPPSVAREAGVYVAVLPFNLGIGGALRTGFAFAVRHGYERAVQFDADGQHDPLAVQLLLDRLDDGADMVIGSRFAEGGAVTYEVSRMRRRAMRFLQWLVRVLVRQRFTDTSSGFRAFSRPMLEYFAATYPVEYMDSVEALVLACNAGFRVEEVAVNMRGRTGGAPSTRRLKLVYYYVRLVVVLVVSTTSRGQRARRNATAERRCGRRSARA